jgi:hypothetical protein
MVIHVMSTDFSRLKFRKSLEGGKEGWGGIKYVFLIPIPSASDSLLSEGKN